MRVELSEAQDFLTSVPILALPVVGEGFNIYYDDFKVGLGCGLI